MNKVEFFDRSEIRMGSPFNICQLRLQLAWSPQLPDGGWQDLWAESPDGRFVALILWHVPENRPGFIVYTLDNLEHTVTRSAPQSGCCEKVWWDGQFRWAVFSAPAN